MDMNEMVEMARDIARQAPFLKLASAFNPKKVVGFEKIRIGSAGDGGYVMLDDFANIDLALSFGVETNADWDLEVATRGIRVQQYDHTVDTSPIRHPLVQFFKKKIVNANDDPIGTTISDIMREAKIRRDASVILKIDIESWEWPVFDSCEIGELRRFSQILVEFHNFSYARDPVWMHRAQRVMDKLSSLFSVCHVHANNWSPMAVVGNVYFPDTLEVSLANRERYTFVDTDEIFPTPIDMPNNPLRPDLYLGTFRFAAPTR